MDIDLIKKITKEYFHNFSIKNISFFDKYFSEDIILSDWELNIQGKDNLINHNKNIFKEFNNISIKVDEMFVMNNKSLSKLYITLDNINLDVVDIISFDIDYKINNIIAYKK